jgi:hypothetical protein
MLPRRFTLAHIHGVPTYQLLVLVALFAGLAGGCRVKARHAAEANELRFYAEPLQCLTGTRKGSFFGRYSPMRTISSTRVST